MISGLPLLKTSAARPLRDRGTWGSGRTSRDRKAEPFGNLLLSDGQRVDPSGVSARWLSYADLWTVYRRVPDVRACVDSIVRRVATWDWVVEPLSTPREKEHAAELAEAQRQAKFLLVPNRDGETWQELIAKVATDLLVFDQGAIECARGSTRGRKVLQELVPVRGSTVRVVTSAAGRVIGYGQSPEYELGGTAMAVPSKIRALLPEDLVYLRLFPTTATWEGNPLIEALIDEISTVMHAAQHLALAYDANEIPSGILVLMGLVGRAAERAVEDITTMRNSNQKLKVLAVADPNGAGAKWIELRHTPKDLALNEVVDNVRRTIWRVFGVTPIEMGLTEGVPRASAEVQLSVGTSHLVNPILEIIEAKITARVLPLLCSDPALVGRTQFRFDRDTKLGAAELLDQARRLEILVNRGIQSRNEARFELGFEPRDGGDVLTVEGTATRLTDLAADPVEDPADPEDPTDPEDGGGSDPGDDSGGDSEDDNPGEAEGGAGTEDDDPGASDPERSRGVSRAALSVDLPPDWEPDGRFRDRRTLDLVGLHDQISGYARDVAPLWEEMASAAVAAISAELSAAGKFSSENAARAMQRIDGALDELVLRWRLAVEPRYQAAARLARDAAVDWTGDAEAVPDHVERAQAYYLRAVGYLTDTNGPIEETRRQLRAVVEGAVRATSPATPETRAAEEDEDEVIEATIAAALLAATRSAHRIMNWAGKLLDLAYDTVIGALAAVGFKTGEDWYGDWIKTGDGKECPTCNEQGDLGIRPLRDIPVRPASGTECGARCRCVLVFWSAAEVRDGIAVAS